MLFFSFVGSESCNRDTHLSRRPLVHMEVFSCPVSQVVNERVLILIRAVSMIRISDISSGSVTRRYNHMACEKVR